MQFTAFAALGAALFSTLALAQTAAGTSPRPDSVASASYCQCVGSFAFQNDTPNKPLTAVVCNVYQGNNTDIDGYSQCFGVGPGTISGFSNFCASYGENGARGARCCNQGQAYKDCAVVVPGVNGK